MRSLRARAVFSGCGLLLVMLASVGSGCDGIGSGDASTRRDPSAGRVFRAVQWDHVWSAGGVADPDALLFPIGLLTADTGMVVVPDAGSHRVVAFRQSDGGLAWSWGREGEAPGEFRQFSDVAINSQGEVVVADRSHGRLTIIDRGGRLVDQVSIPGVRSIEGVCSLPGGAYMVATGGSESRPLLHVSPGGEVLGSFQFPIDEVRDDIGLRRQMQIATAGEHGCIGALKLGWGFILFGPDRPSMGRTYVEPVQLPEVHAVMRRIDEATTQRREKVTRMVLAAMVDPWTRADSLFVPFHGASADGGRIVDVYTAADAEYQYSYRLPVRVQGVVGSGALHFMLVEREGYPVVLALRATFGKTGVAQPAV